MARSYYTILGISPNASLAEIKSAYRRLAKAYHPDRGNTGDSGKFKEIHEAYSVLKDAEKRRQYERHRPSQGQRVRVNRVNTGPRRASPPGGPEPLIPQQPSFVRPRRRHGRRISAFDETGTIDDMMDWILRVFL